MRQCKFEILTQIVQTEAQYAQYVFSKLSVLTPFDAPIAVIVTLA
jgi:hypothetical protein